MTRAHIPCYVTEPHTHGHTTRCATCGAASGRSANPDHHDRWRTRHTAAAHRIERGPSL